MIETKRLKNFTDLLDCEKDMILEWRNDVSIRQWMYRNIIISKKEHYNFIDLLKSDNSKCYFLFSIKDENIGVIYFQNIDNKVAEFGLYTNPKLKGYGHELMENICNYGFKILKLNKLFAEVFMENKKALKLYKSFNFTIYDKNMVNNQQVVYMELKIKR